MDKTCFNKNITYLKQKYPALANFVLSIQPSDTYRVSPSKSGSSCLAKRLEDGTFKNLHSSYDPEEEAKRAMDKVTTENFNNFFVAGFGLGYHILELVQRTGPGSRIIIVEKNPEVFFHALSNVDMVSVFKHPGVSIMIKPDPNRLLESMESDKISFTLNGYCPVVIKSLVSDEPFFYRMIDQSLQKIIRETRLDLKTKATLSKKFYSNFFDNWSNYLQSPGIIPLKGVFKNIPAFIIAAGPSLDKNMGLLHSVTGKAVLISVGTALKPLLNNGVVPQFVVAIDSEEININAFDMDEIPEHLWLLYDPCIPKEIPDKFKVNKMVFDSNVDLPQWIAKQIEEKGSLGNNFSVAHTSFKLAKYLACEPIILVGQDLAFDGHRLHCSESFYNQSKLDHFNEKLTIDLLHKKKHAGYGPSLSSVRDLFDISTTTTTALETYKYLFADEISEKMKVFNATEGGNPIPGVSNISLREAINDYCKESIDLDRFGFRNILRSHPNRNSCNRILEIEIKFFKDILKKIQTIYDKFPELNKISKDKFSGFLLDMENLYKFLFNRPIP